MLLTGCVTQQKRLVEYRTISQKKLPIPADLTSQLDVPAVPEAMTFGDSVLLNAELYGIIERCNNDRTAIRLLDLQ
ncbi:Rz1-like lysis system protein LysC [Kosakonia cowanii]|uniref:Rz1-like lysis system protein LysC n=1 Tax=Kosakonia cowanii TaxID=208223 RepID=UPI00406AB65F